MGRSDQSEQTELEKAKRNTAKPQKKGKTDAFVIRPPKGNFVESHSQATVESALAGQSGSQDAAILEEYFCPQRLFEYRIRIYKAELIKL